MIPDEAVEILRWSLLVTAGYVALLLFIPAPQLVLALAAFTFLVIASGAWFVTEMRKGNK